MVVANRKLVGSAMRTHHGHLLQHGAILLDWDGETQARCLGLADDSRLRTLVTTIAEQLGTVPTREALIDAITTGFADELGVQLEPAQRSLAEERMIEKLLETFDDLADVQ